MNEGMKRVGGKWLDRCACGRWKSLAGRQCRKCSAAALAIKHLERRAK